MKHCFIYSREKDEFQENGKKDVTDQYFTYLSEDPGQIENYASQNGSDAVLLFDGTENRWVLVYARGSGIVTQRTARRRADTASRSGILLSSGKRIGVKSPLAVVSDDNIGDLSKSVQNKYLAHTDLRGID
ncbi:MAG: hypothetical protein FK733_18360 [Asgard group archaeon]|nr:hypothetical protein [Asgard group archaeon]